MHQVEFKFIQKQRVRVVLGPHAGLEGVIVGVAQIYHQRNYTIARRWPDGVTHLEIREDDLEPIDDPKPE